MHVLRNARKWLEMMAVFAIPIIVIVLISVVSAILRYARQPRDESPLPSPNANVADLLRHQTFSTSVRDPGRFPSRFFIVTEGGDKADAGDELSKSFYAGRHVAKTVQGARTLAVVRVLETPAGTWIRPQGFNSPAIRIDVTLCCIDIQNPARRCVLSGSSVPYERSLSSYAPDGSLTIGAVNGYSTAIDGEVVSTDSEWGRGRIVKALLSEVME